MNCTTPQIPPSHASEAVKFAKEFAQQTSNFVKALQLPSSLDPSVLSFKSRSAPYFVKELEDSEIVKPFIQDNVESAVRGSSITVDTSAIIKDISNVLNAFVGGAKATPVFGGFSSTSYRGKYSTTDVIYKVLLTVYAVDASELYDSKPGNVLELAYSAYLTVQKAE